MYNVKESSDLEFLVRLLHVGLQSLEIVDKQEFHFKQVIKAGSVGHLFH